jgi:hypothetical protein
MSRNGIRADTRAVRVIQTNGGAARSAHEVEERYTVVPASFVVFDNHTGQTIQIYQGADAEVRAEQHARHLRARSRRLALDVA